MINILNRLSPAELLMNQRAFPPNNNSQEFNQEFNLIKDIISEINEQVPESSSSESSSDEENENNNSQSMNIEEPSIRTIPRENDSGIRIIYPKNENSFQSEMKEYSIHNNNSIKNIQYQIGHDIQYMSDLHKLLLNNRDYIDINVGYLNGQNKIVYFLIELPIYLKNEPVKHIRSRDLYFVLQSLKYTIPFLEISNDYQIREIYNLLSDYIPYLHYVFKFNQIIREAETDYNFPFLFDCEFKLYADKRSTILYMCNFKKFNMLLKIMIERRQKNMDCYLKIYEKI